MCMRAVGTKVQVSSMLLLVLCAGPAGNALAQGPGKLVKADVPRETKPQGGDAALAAFVAGESAFGFDLYGALRQSGSGQLQEAKAAPAANLFCSPHSIDLALAMCYAGARGKTADELARVLHFGELGNGVHAAINALDLKLAAAAEAPAARGEPLRLHIVNQLWGDAGLPLKPEFLDVLARNYGAGLRLLDFRQPDAAAEAINGWVAEQTEQRIQKLLSADAVRDAVLVLTNAIYFRGSWLHQFEKSRTRPAPFTLLDKQQIQAPMMHQSERYLFARESGLAAVELTYAGGEFGMVLLVPDAGKFADFEKGLNEPRLKDIVGRMQAVQVELALPTFTFRSKFDLKPPLAALGLATAFDPGQADFSGMSSKPLFISAVVHEAFVKVDETGTEAAAATAAGMSLTAMPPREVEKLTVDRPFVFLIRHIQTSEILFLGRVLDPRGT